MNLHKKMFDACTYIILKNSSSAIPEECSRELYEFLHDWVKTTSATMQSIEDNEETPIEAFLNLTKVFK
jgi:hypothetical protein